MKRLSKSIIYCLVVECRVESIKSTECRQTVLVNREVETRGGIETQVLIIKRYLLNADRKLSLEHATKITWRNPDRNLKA